MSDGNPSGEVQETAVRQAFLRAGWLPEVAEPAVVEHTEASLGRVVSEAFTRGPS